MYQRRHWSDEPDPQDEANRQTASLAGVAIILLLLVMGLFLFHALYAETSIEDCLLAGRSNCDVLVGAPPR